MVTIAILDDHRAVLDAVIIALSIRTDIVVQSAFAEPDMLLHNLRSSQPDVLILDVYLSHGNAIAILKTIKAEFPNQKVLLFTSCAEIQLLSELYVIGINGIMPKDAPFETLLQGIIAIAEGKEFYPPSVQALYRQISKIEKKEKKDPSASPLDVLSAVEYKILGFTLQEYTVKEIAQMLAITDHSVERQQKLILQKLGLKNISMLHQFATHYNLFVKFNIASKQTFMHH